MYNKNQYRKTNNKYLLHKIGKRWVTISITMLALLGGSFAMKSVTTHADTTTASAQVTQATNNPVKNQLNNKLDQAYKAGQQSQASTNVGSSTTSSISASVAKPSAVQSQASQMHRRLMLNVSPVQTSTTSSSANTNQSASANNAPSVLSSASSSVSITTDKKNVTTVGTTSKSTTSNNTNSNSSSVNSSSASTVNNKASNNQSVSTTSTNVKSNVASGTSLSGSAKPSFNSAYQSYMTQMSGTDAKVASANASNASANHKPVKKALLKDDANIQTGTYDGLNYKYNIQTGALEFTSGTIKGSDSDIRSQYNNEEVDPEVEQGNYVPEPLIGTYNQYTEDGWQRSTASIPIANLSDIKTIKFDNVYDESDSLSNLITSDQYITSVDMSGVHSSYIQNMANMISGNANLQSINLSGVFNTSATTDMSGMFSNNHNLTSINFGTNFNTSNVTNMNNMFQFDSSLSNLQLPNSFDTSNVTDMGGMFGSMPSISQITLPDSFDTFNVKHMNYMFSGDTNLLNIKYDQAFSTENVSDMSDMFSYDSDLQDIDLSKFNTQNVTNMNNMLGGDTELVSINFGSHFDTSKVQDMTDMFNGDTSLESLTLPSTFNTKNTHAVFEMFPNTLETLTIKSPDMKIPLSDFTNGPQDIGLPNMYKILSDGKGHKYTSLDSTNFTQGITGTFTSNISSDYTYSDIFNKNQPISAANLTNSQYHWAYVDNQGTISRIPIKNNSGHVMIAPVYNGLIYKYDKNTKTIEFVKGNINKRSYHYMDGNKYIVPFLGTSLEQNNMGENVSDIRSPKGIPLSDITNIKFDDNVYTNNVSDMEYMLIGDKYLQNISFGSNFNTNSKNITNMITNNSSLNTITINSLDTRINDIYNGNIPQLMFKEIGNGYTEINPVSLNYSTGTFSTIPKPKPDTFIYNYNGKVISTQQIASTYNPYNKYATNYTHNSPTFSDVVLNNANTTVSSDYSLAHSYKEPLNGSTYNIPLINAHRITAQIKFSDIYNHIDGLSEPSDMTYIGGENVPYTITAPSGWLFINPKNDHINKSITTKCNSKGNKIDVIPDNDGLAYKYDQATGYMDIIGGTAQSDLSNFLSHFNSNILNNLNSINFENSIDMSHAKNLSGMFASTYVNDKLLNLKSINLGSNFNTSNVTDMAEMFKDDEGLKVLSLPQSFNTNNVKTMWGMFNSDINLRSISFPSSFDTQNVTNMGNMFHSDMSLESLDLPDSFNTSNVQTMYKMFDRTYNLKSLVLPNTFDTSKVNNSEAIFGSDDHGDMFKLHTLVIKSPQSKFSNDDLPNMYKENMPSTISTTANDFSKGNIGTFVKSVSYDIKLNNIYHNIDNNQTPPDIQGTLLYGDNVRTTAPKGWALVNQNGSIMGGNDANSTTKTIKYSDTDQPLDVAPVYDGLTYKYNKNANSIEFTGGTAQSDLSNFDYNYNIKHAKSIKFDSDVDVSHVTNMGSMFNGFSDLVSLKLPDNFDTSHVTNMWGMFENDKSLKHLILPKMFNTQHVEDMSDIFNNDSTLQSITIQSPNTIFFTHYNQPGAFQNAYKLNKSGKYTSLHPINLYDGQSHVGTWMQMPVFEPIHIKYELGNSSKDMTYTPKLSDVTITNSQATFDASKSAMRTYDWSIQARDDYEQYHVISDRSKHLNLSDIYHNNNQVVIPIRINSVPINFEYSNGNSITNNGTQLSTNVTVSDIDQQYGYNGIKNDIAEAIAPNVMNGSNVDQIIQHFVKSYEFDTKSNNITVQLKNFAIDFAKPVYAGTASGQLSDAPNNKKAIEIANRSMPSGYIADTTKPLKYELNQYGPYVNIMIIPKSQLHFDNDAKATINYVYKESNGTTDNQKSDNISLSNKNINNIYSALDGFADNYNLPTQNGKIETWSAAPTLSDLEKHLTANNTISSYHPSHTFTYVGKTARVIVNYVDVSSGASFKGDKTITYHDSSYPIIGTQTLNNIGVVGANVNLTATGSNTGTKDLIAPKGYHFVNDSNNERILVDSNQHPVGVQLTLRRPVMHLTMFLGAMPKPQKHPTSASAKSQSSSTSSSVTSTATSTSFSSATSANSSSASMPLILPTSISDQSSMTSISSAPLNNSQAINDLPVSTASTVSSNISVSLANSMKAKVKPVAHKNHHSHIKVVHSTKAIQTMPVGTIYRYHGLTIKRLNQHNHNYYYALITKPVWIYSHMRFTKKNRIKMLKPYSIVHIQRIFKINNTIRLEFKIGRKHYAFITGHNKHIQNAYIQPRKNKKVFKHIILKQNAWTYKNTHYSKKNRIKLMRKGMKLGIKHIKFITKDHMTRIQLLNGHWITANKNFAKLVK